MEGKRKAPKKEFKHEELVWAKVSGFYHWPGQVINPNQSFFIPKDIRTPPKDNMFLVKFFGSFDL